MKLIFLWSDILVLFLVVSILALATYSIRQAHLRSIWRSVFKNSVAIGSAIILSFYVLIALLDSVHFLNNKQQMTSVLDMIITPMKTLEEKTYSAPFATHSFSKETTEQQTREFPLLKSAGRHLDHPSQSVKDIAIKATTGVGLALAIWGILILIARRHIRKSVKLILLLMILIIGFVAALAPYYHIFGTDKVGFDVLYQAIKSIRTGILIGTLTTLIMLPFAILFGLMAGFFQGWIDDVIQYIYTTVNSIPGVLLIAAGILMVQVYISNHPNHMSSLAEQADLRLLFLCLILGITSWTGLCRILRAEVLKIRESDFVLAAKTMGVSPFKIMWRHLLPNVMHIVLITIVLDFSGLVLAEAVLSYIGIGVDTNSYSWGNMINAARMELAREPMVWWSLAAAFSFMFVLVLAANLFADVVRGAFDPRTAK